MSRVEWNATGERGFEAGVDRGVIYTQGGAVAPWNGLKGVNQKAQGAGVTSFYLDGEKFNQMSETEEFSATISAYSYPQEFESCDGTQYLGKGLSVDSQPRELFNLTYRTGVGDDVSGIDAGYKLHLVYNALASPSERNYTTRTNSVDPLDFSWEITTMPIRMRGQTASAHYIIDSRRINKFILDAFEDILYGTAFVAPRFPTPAELTAFFKDALVFTVTNNGDGTWTAAGPSEMMQYLTQTEFQITTGSAKFIDAVTYELSNL